LDELGRLSRLSERLLELASVDHPDVLALRTVDVATLVSEAFRRWSSTVLRDWHEDVAVEGTIQADEDRLRAALDALLDNAVKATGEGVGVTIGARSRGGDLILEVADEGMGIETNQLPGIFERFSRVDGPRTRETGGTGLGLSIVKAIAEAHGGTVEAESRLGRGAAFRIILPGFRSDAASMVTPTRVG
jgi:signal transduction histidine kinase